MSITSKTPMPRTERLRRVVILCCRFARNLAYYRAGREQEFLALQDPLKNRASNFWRATNGNFIDICVLEWCKLFADRTGKHSWMSVVSDPDHFEAGLLRELQLDQAAFQKEIDAMRSYRDKFLAHLDSEEVMNIPRLDLAKKAVWFYHGHIVRHEADPGDIGNLPLGLDEGYEQAEHEARAVYRQKG